MQGYLGQTLENLQAKPCCNCRETVVIPFCPCNDTCNCARLTFLGVWLRAWSARSCCHCTNSMNTHSTHLTIHQGTLTMHDRTRHCNDRKKDITSRRRQACRPLVILSHFCCHCSDRCNCARLTTLGVCLGAWSAFFPNSEVRT